MNIRINGIVSLAYSANPGLVFMQVCVSISFIHAFVHSFHSPLTELMNILFGRSPPPHTHRGGGPVQRRLRPTRYSLWTQPTSRSGHSLRVLRPFYAASATPKWLRIRVRAISIHSGCVELKPQTRETHSGCVGLKPQTRETHSGCVGPMVPEWRGQAP